MSFSPNPSAIVPAALVVSFEVARRLVERHAAGVCPGDIETVDMLAGLGRVLAEGILADRDFPPFDRATRDGYAVRAADLVEVPARLEVVGGGKVGGWPGPGVGGGAASGRLAGARNVFGGAWAGDWDHDGGFAAGGRGRGGDGGAHFGRKTFPPPRRNKHDRMMGAPRPLNIGPFCRR